MNLITKFLFVIFSLFLIYLWNRYIVKNLIHHVIKINGGFDENKSSDSTIKYLARNEKNIYNGFASFYWISAILGSIMILFSD